MNTGQKTSTVKLLYACAQQMGLRPSWVLPNGLFAVSVAGREQYINLTVSPLNSHISASLAKNKYMTRLILERRGLQNIPFVLPASQADAADFLKRHGKIIAKPVSGLGACDIHIIDESAQLEALNIERYILEKYIAGKELRYLILNGTIIGVHRSEYGISVDEHRPLQRISYPRRTWDPALMALSAQIAGILDLKFAAVDYLIDASGRAHILEVNAAPGLKWFHAPTSGPAIDVARLFLEAIVEGQPTKPQAIRKLTLGLQPVQAYS